MRRQRVTPSASAVHGRAGFSRCGRYRYWLRRSWDTRLPRCAFVGLKPSTADAQIDDPTLRRCIRFARDWGYGSLLLVNLFSFCATDPRALLRAEDPIGSRTDDWLKRARRECDLIVAAWGHYGALHGRADDAVRILGEVSCLGVTQSGMPRHPLYCRKTARLTGFYPQSSAAH